MWMACTCGADDGLGRSMTNGRGRLPSPRGGASPEVSRRACDRRRVAPRDAPRTSRPSRRGHRGWSRTNQRLGRPESKGQPQAHSRSALVAPMLAANSSTPLRSGARSCSCATTPSRCKARRNETFPESIMEASAAATPALGARERIARTRPTRPTPASGARVRRARDAFI